MDFSAFPKIPRMNRAMTLTEKIDGSNAVIYIGADDGEFLTGSRPQWITPDKDNLGFSRWAHENKDQLIKILGPGWHRGEWWGQGIQRRYGLTRKVFSLFNTARWADLPCNPVENPGGLVYRVPELYVGPFDTGVVRAWLDRLREKGSFAAPFMDPEGLVVYHHAANQYFKVTLVGDEGHKGAAE